MREKLREVLGEKIKLENELNQIETIESSRINEIEAQFTNLNGEYKKTLEENKAFKAKEYELKREVVN